MRAAVCDLHHHLLAVLGVPHLEQGAHGILQMRAGHAVTVIRVAVAHAPAMKSVGIVGGISLLGLLGIHSPCAAEYRCHKKSRME